MIENLHVANAQRTLAVADADRRRWTDDLCSGTKRSLYASPCIEYDCRMTVLDTHPEDAFANDRAHVFHSWSAQGTLNPLVVTGAEGSYFWTEDGTRYLDFSSQLVNVNIGHQHPEAGRGDQGAGRPAVHGRAVPRQRRPQRGGPADLRGRRREDRRQPARHGVLHQRRRRGHRERDAHGPPAHRSAQGADHTTAATTAAPTGPSRSPATRVAGRASRACPASSSSGGRTRTAARSTRPTRPRSASARSPTSTTC